MKYTVIYCISIFLIISGCGDRENKTKQSGKDPEKIPAEEKAPEPVEKINFAHRKYFNAKLEPEKTVISGAGLFHMNEFNNLAYRVLDSTSRPAICLFELNLKGINNYQRYLKKIENKIDTYEWYVIPLINLSMNTGTNPDLSYEYQVAQGRYNKEIDSLCIALKKWNRPVFLKIGLSANGHDLGYKPWAFKDAYVKIAKALKKHKVAEVALVWGTTPGIKEKSFMEYYPGNDFVEWWSLSLFKSKLINDSTTQAFLDSALYFKKPVMIGEASAAISSDTLHGKSDWDAWFKPFFKLIENTPQIKAFCYINTDWTVSHTPQWGNARIELNNYISNEFKRHLHAELYLGGQSKSLLQKTLKIKQARLQDSLQ